MNDHNNIDDFFRKSLDSSKPSENKLVPDPVIWENAHEKIKDIYRQKRKRRLLIFFIFFIGLSLSIFSYYNYHTNSSKLASDNFQEINITIDSSSEKIKNESKNRSQDDLNGLSPYDKIPNKLNPLKIKQYKNSFDKKSKTVANLNNSNNLNIVDNGNKFENHTNQVISENNQIYKPENTNNIKSFMPLPKLQIKSVSYAERKTINFQKNAWNKISDLKDNKVEHRNWKFGISHSRFFINPFTKQKQDNDIDQTITLEKSTYMSVDLMLERRINKHFSLSTGLNYFQQSINVGFDLKNLEYQTNENVKELLVLTRDAFTNNIIKNANDLKINFLPNSNVMDGDILEFQGNIPYKLDAIQIPFSLKYRYNIGRHSLWTSSGLVGTLLQVKVEDLPIRITKDELLVSEDINYSPIFNTRILPNISFAIGSEINLYKNFYLSLGMYTFNFNNELLRYNIGMNYEF